MRNVRRGVHQQPLSEEGPTASHQEGGSRRRPRAKQLPSGRLPCQGGPLERPLRTPGPPVGHATIMSTSAEAKTCICVLSAPDLILCLSPHNIKRDAVRLGCMERVKSNLSGSEEQGLQVAEISPKMPQFLLGMAHMIVSEMHSMPSAAFRGERPSMCRRLPAHSDGRPP